MTARKTGRVRIALVTVTAFGMCLATAGPAAAMRVKPGDKQYPGGESQFEEDCRMAGGQFSRSPNGVIECEFDNGTLIACDAGGRNCRTWEADYRRPGDYGSDRNAPTPSKPRRG